MPALRVLLRMIVGELELCCPLDRPPRLGEGRVVGERNELLQLVEIGHPARRRSRSVMIPDRPGLLLSSQRRCVTPLVLLLNFSGHSS